VQPLNGDEKNCYNYIVNNSDIILAYNCLSGIAATCHDFRRVGKCHQLERAGEDRLVSYPDWSSNVYDYFCSSYGITFFIGERKKHYSNINNFIFKPIAGQQSLTPTDDLFVNLSFFLHIPTDSPYYNDARMHLTIDRKHTLDLIDTLQTYIEQHTRGLNRLQEIFDATIDKAFRRPTPLVGYYNYMNKERCTHTLPLLLLLVISSNCT
jgi:hypothetical protein